MADQIKVRGMVIAVAPIGENDNRIVLLTKDKGKVSAFARGARRPGNHLMAACSTFAFGSFYLYPQRESYSLQQADIEYFFRELTEDLTATYMAYYFLELADYYAVENQGARDMLNLLYMSFKALLNPRLDKELIRYIFELKMLAINGEYPEFFACTNCGSRDDLTSFSIAGNGVLCKQCSHVHPDAINIGETTLYTLQYIMCTAINKLFTFTVSDEVKTELRMVMNRCVHSYIDRKMNSLDILEQIL